jgi:prepilin-type processing-associated H-X9-DG protein
MKIEDYFNPPDTLERTSHGSQLPYMYDLVTTYPDYAYVHKGRWNVLFADGRVGLYSEGTNGYVSTMINTYHSADGFEIAGSCRDLFESAK